MFEDRWDALYGSAHLDACSSNGQFSVSATRIGNYGTHPGWLPVFWHSRQRHGSWPSYDAAFGFELGEGVLWNGQARVYVVSVPHCCIVLLLLLVPAGRYVVWRIRGRVTPGRQVGFDLKPA